MDTTNEQQATSLPTTRKHTQSPLKAYKLSSKGEGVYHIIRRCDDALIGVAERVTKYAWRGSYCTPDVSKVRPVYMVQANDKPVSPFTQAGIYESREDAAIDIMARCAVMYEENVTFLINEYKRATFIHAIGTAIAMTNDRAVKLRTGKANIVFISNQKRVIGDDCLESSLSFIRQLIREPVLQSEVDNAGIVDVYYIDGSSFFRVDHENRKPIGVSCNRICQLDLTHLISVVKV